MDAAIKSVLFLFSGTQKYTHIEYDGQSLQVQVIMLELLLLEKFLRRSRSTVWNKRIVIVYFITALLIFAMDGWIAQCHAQCSYASKNVLGNSNRQSSWLLGLPLSSFPTLYSQDWSRTRVPTSRTAFYVANSPDDDIRHYNICLCRIAHRGHRCRASHNASSGLLSHPWWSAVIKEK